MLLVALIRVGNRLPRPPLDMVEQQRQLRLRTRRLQRPQVGEVSSIESDDMVEAVEVGWGDLPGTEV